MITISKKRLQQQQIYSSGLKLKGWAKNMKNHPGNRTKDRKKPGNNKQRQFLILSEEHEIIISRWIHMQ